MPFRIYTLRAGDLKLPVGHGHFKDEPVNCWYVTDGATKILVDSGLPSPEEMKAKWRVESTGGGSEGLRRALAECGAAPEEIQTVILTHMHFDHAWNLELFPQAKVLVQKAEFFHAVDPVPTHRIYYTRQTLIDLLQRKRPTAFSLVDGDMQLMEGIQLLKVPGHTPGMQVVIVQTERGRVGLVSDLGENYGCWFPADPRATSSPNGTLRDTFLPGHIRSESEETYLQSMRKVKAQADIVLMAHDDRVPRIVPDQWWEIPEGGTSA